MSPENDKTDENQEENLGDPEELTPEELARRVTEEEDLPEESSDEPAGEQPKEEKEEGEAVPGEDEEEVEQAGADSAAQEDDDETAGEEDPEDLEDSEEEESGGSAEDDEELEEKREEEDAGEEQEEADDVEEEIEEATEESQEETADDEELEEAEVEGKTEEEEEAEAEPEGEETSIKEVLEREVDRVKAEKEEEEAEEEAEEPEEELPGDYLSPDELPEPEEFEVPGWIKKSGWGLLALLATYLLIIYLVLPGIEVLLTRQIQSAAEAENYHRAEFFFRLGYLGDGALISEPDKFAADYLRTLLQDDQLDRFTDNYDEYFGNPVGPYTRKIYAEYLLREGNWEELLELGEELQLDPQVQGAGFIFTTRANLELGNLREAMADFEYAGTHRWGDASIDRLERDIALADEDYSRAATASARLFNRLDAAVPIEERRSWNRFDQLLADDYVYRGDAWFELENEDAAIRMYETALVDTPYHPRALEVLVRHLTIERRWPSVRPYLIGDDRFYAYRSLYPLDSLGWWTLAEFSFRAQNQAGRAIPLAERAREIQPREPEIERIVGEIYLFELDSPSHAVAHLELAREYGLERLEFIKNLSRAYYEAELYLLALDEFEELREHPDVLEDSPELLYNIASSYLGAEMLDQADEYLDRAEDAGFEEPTLFNQRGLIRELQGEEEAAVVNFFQGAERAEEVGEQEELLNSNLNRFWEDIPPEPLPDWIAPVNMNF